MTIWQFNDSLSRRLLTWNLINVAVGVLLGFARPFWRGVGSQSVGWGLINVAIALVGQVVTSRRHARLPDPLAPEVMFREAHNLRRLLWVNTALDVLYMIGGVRLAQTRGRSSSMWKGIGLGIVIQGALLFVFDLIHARIVPEGRQSDAERLSRP